MPLTHVNELGAMFIKSDCSDASASKTNGQKYFLTHKKRR